MFLFVFRTTKTNLDALPRVEHMALVPISKAPTLVLQHLRSLSPDDPVLPIPGANVARLLKLIPVPQAYRESFDQRPGRRTHDHFTLHSPKRGAISELWKAASAKALDPRLIPLAAKRRSAWNETIPSVTIGYAAVLRHVAVALDMQTIPEALW